MGDDGHGVQANQRHTLEPALDHCRLQNIAMVVRFAHWLRGGNGRFYAQDMYQGVTFHDTGRGKHDAVGVAKHLSPSPKGILRI